MPVDTLAASPPWTVTTEYGEVSDIHPKGHNGIDFSLPMNTPVKSTVEGIVEVVRDEGKISYGKSVRIRTGDGRLVIYAHLNSMDVNTGDYVKFGDVIGHSGNSGHSTGPHLHFEVRINGKPVDPNPTIWKGMIQKSITGGK